MLIAEANRFFGWGKPLSPRSDLAQKRLRRLPQTLSNGPWKLLSPRYRWLAHNIGEGCISNCGIATCERSVAPQTVGETVIIQSYQRLLVGSVGNSNRDFVV